MVEEGKKIAAQGATDKAGSGMAGGIDTRVMLHSFAEHARLNAGISIALIIVVIVAIYLAMGTGPVSCGGNADCFRKTLLECRDGASMEFSDDIPVEGTFSYRFDIRGEKQITAGAKACEIEFSANQTTDGIGMKQQGGKCYLREYADIGRQFDWARADGLDGACIRLERKLNGQM